jgi:hypothetical protein
VTFSCSTQRWAELVALRWEWDEALGAADRTAWHDLQSETESAFGGWMMHATVPYIIYPTTRNRSWFTIFLALWPSSGLALSRPRLPYSVSHAVPSAPKGLTSVFGMGTGAAPSIQPPGKSICQRPLAEALI